MTRAVGTITLLLVLVGCATLVIRARGEYCLGSFPPDAPSTPCDVFPGVAR